MRKHFVLSFALTFSACGGASLNQLKTSAAFSLSCHEARIAFREISREVYFATGCDREARFVERCEGSFRENCRWQLASTVYPAGTEQKERDLAEERRHGTAPDR